MIAAAGYARLAQKGDWLKYIGLGLWILMTLVLSKSLGALMITLALLPLTLFFKPRLQLLICAGFASVVLLYPTLRGADLIPVDRAVEFAQGISEERARSLQFRIDNENALLARSQERPVFGWGGWGRSSTFDEDGIESSTPDGYWVIIVGQGGWIRYLGEFGLLCMPIILAAASYRRNRYGLETSVLAIALTIGIIDLVPNATISPITWMLAGALWGRIELGRLSQKEAPTVVEEPQTRRAPGYTRFPNGPTPVERPSAARRDEVSKRDSKPAPRYSRFSEEK